MRDILLGKEPKDFDIATNARPEQICALFHRCRLIGRRFRLAHIYFGREAIEVVTFRGADSGTQQEHVTESGRILSDNVFGNIEEDALRRDFTVNALYYNIEDFSIVDYTDGMTDLRAGVLRLIGDPETRYREDPVRMLRAVRLATKLDFIIDKASAEAIETLGDLLQDISASRLFEEVRKLFLSGAAAATCQALREYGLFQYLFPETCKAIAHSNASSDWLLIEKAMYNTDERIREDKPVTPAFLLAVLLWPAVKELVTQRRFSRVPPAQALDQAGAVVAGEQSQVISIPKRFSHPMREIWRMQPRFDQTGKKSAERLMHHPRFRAAYDFLLLRSEVGEVDPELVQWWTAAQLGNEELQRKRAASARRRRGRKRHRGTH